MSRKQKNTDVQWFVEPFDAKSNEIITFFLIEMGKNYPDYEHVMVPDHEGMLHNVFEVSYREMAYLVKSKASYPECKFAVWNRTRFNAPLRKCDYLFSKGSTRQSAEAKRVKERLTKIKSPPIDEPEPF